MRQRSTRGRPPPSPLVAYAALALAIAGAAGLYVLRSQRELQAQVERELSSIADSKVSLLAGWRERQQRAWSDFRASPFLGDALRRTISGDARDEALLARVAHVFEAKRAREGASAALLLDAGGRLLLATPGAAPPTARDRELVQAALATAHPVIDEGEHAGEPLSIAAAIPGRPEERGVVLARYDLAQALTPTVRHWPHHARSAEPVLVRREGDFVVPVTPPLHTVVPRLPLSLDIPSTRAVKGANGIVECDDYRGVPVIAAVRPVPGSPWFLSVKVDRAEVFAAGREHALAFAAVTLMLLVIGATAAWLWHRAERARAQDRERAAEAARYQATLLENLHDGIIGLDPRGRITAWAGAAQRIYGFTPEEALGQPIAELLRGERPEEVRRAIEAGLASDGRCSLEVRHQRKDGQPVDVEVTAIAIRDGAGALTGFVAVHRDVTDRRRAEQEQQRLQAELVFADRLASIGTLAAGVAHEINNPLAYLVANVDFVAERLRAPAREDRAAQLAAIEDAADGARRIAEIVRGLRVFSRRDGGEQGGVVSVDAAVQAAVRMAQGQARPRARLAVELGGTPLVPGREHEVAQVALNLILNAIQAIPVGRTEDNEVRVATRVAPDGGVVLTVSDTGSGIAPEHLAQIFEPFFTTKAGEGSGLGLPICRGIVERMGGTIAVESASGRTTFTVWLPSGGAPARRASAPVAAAGARRGRVLVVDDEPLVCSSVRRALGEAHEVVVAHDARAALAILGEDGPRFDVVLCDVVMPGMSGLELYEELARSRPELAARVLFLTGGAFTPGSRDFLAGNAVRVIEKPFEPAALRARVAEALRPGAA